SCASPRHLLLIYLYHVARRAVAVGDHPNRSVNCGACSQLGTAPERSIAQFWIEVFQRESAHNLVSQKTAVDGIRIFPALQHKLIEPWRPREQQRGVFAQLLSSVGGLCQV